MTLTMTGNTPWLNPKAISTYLGHAAISITLDTYGHLLRGNEAEAAQLLDAYLGSSQITNEGRTM